MKIIWNSISMCIKEVLLGYGHADLFTYCLWLFAHYSSSAEQLQYRLYDLSSLKHLLSGSSYSLLIPSLGDKIFLQQYVNMRHSVMATRGEIFCHHILWTALCFGTITLYSWQVIWWSHRIVWTSKIWAETIWIHLKQASWLFHAVVILYFITYSQYLRNWMIKMWELPVFSFIYSWWLSQVHENG